jgi:hypothetical protein
VKRRNGWCTGTCLENISFFTTTGKLLHPQDTLPPLLEHQTVGQTFFLNHVLLLAAAPLSFIIASGYKNPPRPELSTSSGNFTLIINDSHHNFSCLQAKSGQVHRKSRPTFPPDFSLPNFLIHSLRLSRPNISFITAISSHHG